MKKLLKLTIGLITCIGLVSCQKEKKEEPLDFEITVKFSFGKSGKAKKDNIEDWFEDSTFEINTKIYVFVDFAITKHCSTEEVINFEVQIPYAEYYSTKDYYSGTVKPHVESYDQEDKNGNKYTVMELSRMSFIIEDNEINDFHYVFEIEANQECENANFITRYYPDNRHLSWSVNKNKSDDKAMTNYTFIRKA